MTAFKRIMSLKPQASDNANRITVEWGGNSYSIKQSILKHFTTALELKTALDNWTQANLGYVINDIFFHRNRDGTWAVATGEEPQVWPEDEVIP